MAEGTLPGTEAVDLPEAAEEEEAPAVETVEAEPLVVRPKQRDTRKELSAEDPESQEEGENSQVASSYWWQSPAVRQGVSKSQTPAPTGPQFQGWREHRWAEEDDGEWSYSTGVGSTTMDILRERFGEASFRDAPSWQPWAPGGDHADSWQKTGSAGPGSGSRIRLASPKFRPKPTPQQGGFRGDSRGLRGPASSLGEVLRGGDQPPPDA